MEKKYKALYLLAVEQETDLYNFEKYLLGSRRFFEIA